MDTMIFGWTALVLLGYMLYGYVLAILKHDFSVVDVAYGLGFVVAAWTGISFYSNLYGYPDHYINARFNLGNPLILAYLCSNKKKGEEDFRYTEMRNNWGKKCEYPSIIQNLCFPRDRNLYCRSRSLVCHHRKQ